ncbi:hypothetical protein Rs2_38566 [Raphanus sativus]|nr:hypothetical protein Rs2_38566 [Raphanus sativus]
MSNGSPSKTLDSPVDSRARSETLGSVNSSSQSPEPIADAEGPCLDVAEYVPSGDEAEESLLVGPVSKIGRRDVEECKRKYDLPQDLEIRVPGLSDRILDFEVD